MTGYVYVRRSHSFPKSQSIISLVITENRINNEIADEDYSIRQINCIFWYRLMIKMNADNLIFLYYLLLLLYFIWCLFIIFVLLFFINFS